MKLIYKMLSVSWLVAVAWIIFVDIKFLMSKRHVYDNNKFGILVIAAVYLSVYVVGSTCLVVRKWHRATQERKQTLLVTPNGKIVKQKV